MNSPQSSLDWAGRRNQGRNGLRGWLSDHYAMAIFVSVFFIPTLAAALYFFVIASDRYVSEMQFVVRSASKPAAEGAAAYLQDFGISRANDDAYAVQDYIRSRDAMHAMGRQFDLRRIWRPSYADILSRYRGPFGTDSDEALFRHYLKEVKVEKNLETGITTVRVYAYRAADANALSRMILRLSEAKVNAMNSRARSDRLQAAELAARSAARNLAETTSALSAYRDRTRLVDPEQSADATARVQSGLEADRARVKADLAGMSERAPANPAIPAMRRRLEALDREIAAQTSALAGNAGSLAGKVGGYEQSLIERELAGKLYEAAQKQLDSANEEAMRQQIFLETVANPSLPDTPLEPRRMRYTFTVALLSFWASLGIYLLLSGSREHLNVH